MVQYAAPGTSRLTGLSLLHGKGGICFTVQPFGFLLCGRLVQVNLLAAGSVGLV